MSAVGPTQSSEAGGLQGTAQNLGSSLGTAIIGAVLLASLATGFNDRIANNPNVPEEARLTIARTTQEGIDIVPVAVVEQAATDAGLSEVEAQAIADDYGDAQLEALRLALGAVALAALLSLWFTRRLPSTSLVESSETRRRTAGRGIDRATAVSKIGAAATTMFGMPPMRVLIVEDHPGFRRVAREPLEARGSRAHRRGGGRRPGLAAR